MAKVLHRALISLLAACSADGTTTLDGGTTDPDDTWKGTATETARLAGSGGTVNRDVTANVTWKLDPADPTGGTFQATGTATYSMSGTYGPCTIELPPVVLTISGTLTFYTVTMPPSYYATGGNPIEQELCYQLICPDSASMSVCGPPKPWLTTGMELFSPQDETIAGSLSDGSGITYAWSFTKE